MRKIVFVSRLDTDCSLGAFVLCDIAPLLARKYEDLEIIIVGGGNKYPQICKKATQINNIINRRLIFAAGFVDDPSVYFEGETIFVGVSRAALEAMAYGLPTILLGNEGYLGLLNEKNLEFAQKTNFTCRGAGGIYNITDLTNSLFNEISCFFNLDEEEKAHISSFSYQIVKKGCSAHYMAQKTLDVYRKTVAEYNQNRPRKIAICGYYGHKNLGDEAILSIIKQKLLERSKNVKICLVRGKNPLKIASSLIQADIFIFGGGSLLQNSTSNASLFYYIAIVHLANLLCKQKIMLSNGIGPIENGLIPRQMLLNAIKKAVNTFDYISVRDTDSQKLLSRTLPNRKIHLIPDPALLCEEKAPTTNENSTNKRFFVYIPCANGLKKSRIDTTKLAHSLSKIEKQFEIQPVIAILNTQQDFAIAKKLKSDLKGAKIVCPTTPNELFSLFKEAKWVISQRYHGSLFALTRGIPTLAVSNDPKMHALCKDFGAFPCQNAKILVSDDELIRKLLILEKKYKKLSPLQWETLKRNRTIINQSFKKLFQNF